MQTRPYRKTSPNLKKQLKAVSRGPCAYVIKMSDIYKIGHSNNLYYRVLSLYWESGYPADFELSHYIPVTGSYDKLSTPEQYIERHLHQKFKDKRIYYPRELFRLDSSDLDYIKSIKEYRDNEIVFYPILTN